MTGDARQFKLELDRFAESIKQQAAAFQRQVTADLFGAIILATPVGNATRWKGNVARAAKGKPPLPKGYVGGQARRNWRIAKLAPDRSVLPGTDASGQAATAAAYGVLATITEPVTIWISNPLPYMDALENGWSKQAPGGIVGQAVRAIAAKYGLRVA